MGRRKKGNPINGWLVLNKPLGLSSMQAVAACRRIFDARKVGHAGTLDPLATGVLPIAFGEATKTVAHLVDDMKRYRFQVTWGAETTTDDAEGESLNTSDARPSEQEIDAALSGFIGDIMQLPPKYSAIKVNGERAYALARGGEDVSLNARPVYIQELRRIRSISSDVTEFEAYCGKGTYVRSLARDLGQILGCFGHITKLVRSEVGPFIEQDAIALEKLEEISNKDGGPGALLNLLHPIQAALDDIPAVSMDANDASRLKRGQSVLLRGRDAPIHSGLVYATSRGSLIAIGEVRQGSLFPTRVFNSASIAG